MKTFTSSVVHILNRLWVLAAFPHIIRMIRNLVVLPLVSILDA
jgi:hypothetical protein